VVWERNLLRKVFQSCNMQIDTILLMQNNCEQARNLKFILCLLEQLCGLKIEFHKSEIYCLGAGNNKAGTL
jgi:hypothetical protein